MATITCEVCGRSAEAKRHPCRFAKGCACWRGQACTTKAADLRPGDYIETVDGRTGIVAALATSTDVPYRHPAPWSRIHHVIMRLANGEEEALTYGTILQEAG